MRFKYVRGTAIAIGIVAVLTRFCELLIMTENETGFIKPEFLRMATLFNIVLTILLIGIVVVSLMTLRRPKQFIFSGKIVAAFSGLTALSLLAGLVATALDINGIGDIVSVALLGLSAVSFVHFTMCAITEKSINKLATLPPIGLWLVRLFLTFTAYTGMVNILDTVFEIFMLCAVLLFFVNFGKIVCNLSEKTSYKLVLVTGLLAPALCFICTIPRFALFVMGKNLLLHESAVSDVSVFVTGLFILTVVLELFKDSNSLRHNKNTTSTTEKLAVEQNSINFIIPD